MSETTAPPATATATRWVLVLTLYLLGLFMGALDTGIVTPARTVIQSDLGVTEKKGIWMITVYTLAYAAAIPVMGKLADRIGRKPLYLFAIALFGAGSLLCGLSQDTGSFALLIVARVIQAIGGGGIVPIATAEVGTSVPPGKRGMALGLVGGVYGIANVFGASAGSLILDIAGTANWQWIFYINVPIAIAIIVVGAKFLPVGRSASERRVDLAGITVLVLLILSLLYGLRNLDFFDLGASIRDLDVYPFLLAAIVLAVVLIAIEWRAADPVLNLHYFTDRTIGVTLLIAALTGVVLMSIIFIPQFAENSLRMPTGSGGYLVVILGLASGVGAPLSGRLTDQIGPRAVLGLGALISVAAALTLVFWTAPHPGTASVVIALVLMGLGLGFLIGSPINYLMLHSVPDREATSALATLSLVRAVGTTLAPAILVGLLANSLAGMPATLMAQMPRQISIGALPHAAELQAKFDQMKTNPAMADEMAGLEIPDLTATTIDIDMGAPSGSLPPDLQLLLRNADVTTIVDRSAQVAQYMFDQQSPERVSQIQSGVGTAISALGEQGALLDAQITTMRRTGAPTAALEAARAEIQTTVAQLQELSAAIPDAFAQAKLDYVAQLRANGAALEATFQHELNMGFVNLFWFYGIASALTLALLVLIPGRAHFRSSWAHETEEAATPEPSDA